MEAHCVQCVTCFECGGVDDDGGGLRGNGDLHRSMVCGNICSIQQPPPPSSSSSTPP